MTKLLGSDLLYVIYCGLLTFVFMWKAYREVCESDPFSFQSDKYGLLKASSSEAYAFVINIFTSGNWFSIARFLTHHFTN